MIAGDLTRVSGSQWVTGGMMGAQAGMMGTGWMTPDGAGYGMMFGFTTQ